MDLAYAPSPALHEVYLTCIPPYANARALARILTPAKDAEVDALIAADRDTFDDRSRYY